MGKGVIYKHLLNRELISILQVNLCCRGKSERDHMALSHENNRFAALKKKKRSLSEVCGFDGRFRK